MDDYDDWVERLDPHARQRFEWMNGRITELTNGWRAADAERDAQARNAADAHAERARQFRRAADALDERDAARGEVGRLRAENEATIREVEQSTQRWATLTSTRQADKAEIERLKAALGLHIYEDGHTVDCPENGAPSDRCDAKCWQTRAALEEAPS